jgi:hypothetical protein
LLARFFIQRFWGVKRRELALLVEWKWELVLLASRAEPGALQLQQAGQAGRQRRTRDQGRKEPVPECPLRVGQMRPSLVSPLLGKHMAVGRRQGEADNWCFWTQHLILFSFLLVKLRIVGHIAK